VVIDFGGHSPHDYLRALREGGPMDRIVLTCRCQTCGNRPTESARWYHENEMKCHCGGEFDSSPFVEAVMFMSGKLKAPTENFRFTS
jgi:hypothetical protein